MKKKFNHYMSLSLLLLSVLPFSLVSAETVEEVPTGGTTISSMADDPLKELKEKAANQVPTIESTPESESVEDTPTSESETKEDVPKTEDTTESKPKPQTRGGGIGPQTVNLIEGVDIDAGFAQLLRTVKGTTNDGGAWSGYGKGVNQLTDDDMAGLTVLSISNMNLTSLKGVEYATNLTRFNCSDNQLSNIDISSNIKLEILFCNNNNLTNLDVSSNGALLYLNCDGNQLTSIDVSGNFLLQTLYCNNNKLTNFDIKNHPSLIEVACQFNELVSINVEGTLLLEKLLCAFNKLKAVDVSNHTSIQELMCGYNELTNLEIDGATSLRMLSCEDNQLTSLNTNTNTSLWSLWCDENKLSTLDLTNNKDLRYLTINNNQLTSLNIDNLQFLDYVSCVNNNLTILDASDLKALREIRCQNNKLSTLNLNGAINLQEVHSFNNQLTNVKLSSNTLLRYLHLDNNQLSSIDVSSNVLLEDLYLSFNKLDQLEVKNNTLLTRFNCMSNELTVLDVSSNKFLEKLGCSDNRITDITSVYNLNNLTEFVADQQRVFVPVPAVSSGGEATVDILKTTANAGLSASNVDITPAPGFTYNGDKILLSNVTKESLSEKKINFSYDGNQLVEGASSGTKSFGGTITFFSVSDLASKLKPDRKKVKSGGKVEWTWTIASLTVKKAESIRATLDTLPSGVVIDPSSVKKDGISTSINDLYGTSLGDLDYGESMVLTFETTVTGNVDEWKELKGALDWEDDTISSPHHNETKGRVQVHDDEQTYTPKDSDDMAIQSVPVYFNHGTNPIMSTAQTYHLHAMNYQSNTKVVTDGFYTRIKDDRAISTGWKLTAKLSDFKDSSNQPMPNGTGTMLKLENMSIERVTDRDTPQEVIDPTPSGSDVPSSVQATETLVAGQSTAKTIVSAQPNEGQDTWQLRMPFDKVSLNIPANAGKKGKVYKANLTWSLDDTP